MTSLATARTRLASTGAASNSARTASALSGSP
jgi:hypothetical protein